MAYSTLVGLKLSDARGLVERDIIVQEAITLYNLHRVLQFCLFSSKSDDQIAATPYTFKHKARSSRLQSQQSCTGLLMAARTMMAVLMARPTRMSSPMARHIR